VRVYGVELRLSAEAGAARALVARRAKATKEVVNCMVMDFNVLNGMNGKILFGKDGDSLK
jgi:hypothetical protein